MCSLDDSPELTPHLDVLLEGRNSKSHIILLYVGDIPTPLKEGHVFLSLDLGTRHVLSPLRPSGNFEELILRILHSRLREQEVA